MDSNVADSHLLLYIVDGKFPWEASVESSASSSCVEMDPEVWSKLPEEILDRVMLVLPYTCQLRCRGVSKSWYGRLTSLNFLQRSGALALPVLPMVCAFEYRHGSRHMEDARSPNPGKPLWRKTGRRAYKVDLSFLPAKIQKWRSKRAVANDGLICVQFSQKRRVHVGGKDRLETVEVFCVLNPITRTWRQVPELDTNNLVATAMQVQADKTAEGCFIVYVVCRSESLKRKKWTINTYSSRTNTWKTTGGDPAPVSYYTWCHCVFLNNLLYSFEVEEMMLLNLDDGKLVKHGKVGRPVSDFEGNNFHLVDHQGTVYFAGETYHGTTDPWFLVWRLDEAAMAWELISEMPAWIHDRLVKPTRLNRLADCTFCIGDAVVVGDYIYFTLGVQSIPTYGSWSQFGAAKIGSWSHIITYHIPDQKWDLTFEKISDLVCKRYADPCGFFVPNYSRLR